ncbi:MAG TPA: RlmE family RNA methyltransferase [Gammaproteobacteria bacterium]|nr:RlmE family RNA methyltransferase [Gammaproteobacteria bacterium]
MSRLTGSSSRWLRRQEKDPYVERAAREGWRSRAVYKLEQLQAKERLLKPGLRCVDLGASPGSWSQYAAKLVGPRGKVWSVDLLPMVKIPGVDFLQGDFTSPETLEALRLSLGGEQADLVMSDMAPNISGNRTTDQARSIGLAEEALLFASEVLRPGGNFLVKLFQGEGLPEFAAGARGRFETARLVKPKASRSESREIYLLARNYGV